ncbi:MAG: succinate dehydrogenase assembly factor 2 [Pseudomonadota bacterium]
MSGDLDKLRKKLLYRASYRGFKEADILIGAFARERLGAMNAGELEEFEALLSVNDRDLYAWAVGDSEPPANLDGPVMQAIKAFQLMHG